MTKSVSKATDQFKPAITVFHCCSAIGDVSTLADGECTLKGVIMPCSVATREVFLLRAFESGADAVAVIVCPEGQCRHLQGNIRAAKRVTRMKKLVDDIGLDSRRLNLFNVPRGDAAAVERVISQVVEDLSVLGPNPAHSKSNGTTQ